jgi:hypothetical protein
LLKRRSGRESLCEVIVEECVLSTSLVLSFALLTEFLPQPSYFVTCLTKLLLQSSTLFLCMLSQGRQASNLFGLATKLYL